MEFNELDPAEEKIKELKDITMEMMQTNAYRKTWTTLQCPVECSDAIYHTFNSSPEEVGRGKKNVLKNNGQKRPNPILTLSPQVQ